jgi:hypothetical protein
MPDAGVLFVSEKLTLSFFFGRTVAMHENTALLDYVLTIDIVIKVSISMALKCIQLSKTSRGRHWWAHEISLNRFALLRAYLWI